MNIGDLITLGLTKNEASIYLKLFELGQVKAGELITETGLLRNIVYRSLDGLISRGLVTRVYTEKVASFRVNDPSVLVDIMNEKKNLAVKVTNDLRSIRNIVEERVIIYTGKQGFKKAFGDILKVLSKDDELLVMGIFDFDTEFEKMIVDFHKKRASLGISCKIFASLDAVSITSKLEKMNRTQIRFFGENIVTPAVFLIFNDRLLMSLPDEKTFIRVNDKKVADSFESYFKLLWTTK